MERHATERTRKSAENILLLYCYKQIAEELEAQKIKAVHGRHKEDLLSDKTEEDIGCYLENIDAVIKTALKRGWPLFLVDYPDFLDKSYKTFLENYKIPKGFPLYKATPASGISLIIDREALKHLSPIPSNVADQIKEMQQPKKIYLTGEGLSDLVVYDARALGRQFQGDVCIVSDAVFNSQNIRKRANGFFCYLARYLGNATTTKAKDIF